MPRRRKPASKPKPHLPAPRPLDLAVGPLVTPITGRAVPRDPLLDDDLDDDWDDEYALGLPGLADIAAAINRGMSTASAILKACAARPEERILVVADNLGDPTLRAVFMDSIGDLGATAEPMALLVNARELAFDPFPPYAIDMFLGAQLVIDITTLPWWPSESFARYVVACAEAGSRLAIVGGDPDNIATFIACPPTAGPMTKARRGFKSLTNGRALRLTSRDGTDLSAEIDADERRPRFIGDPPTKPGMIGWPLCASVAVPFAPGSAHGVVALRGAGRFEGPDSVPFTIDRPVPVRVEAGRVVDIDQSDENGEAVADWFAEADDEDAYLVTGCHFGFDPRVNRETFDANGLRSTEGGIMLGIGLPSEHLPSGPYGPGRRFDFRLMGLDADLDGRPFLRNGKYTRDSGVR